MIQKGWEIYVRLSSKYKTKKNKEAVFDQINTKNIKYGIQYSIENLKSKEKMQWQSHLDLRIIHILEYFYINILMKSVDILTFIPE